MAEAGGTVSEAEDRERDHRRQRAGRLHGRALHLARGARAARDRGLPVGRPAAADDRRRELPRLPRGRHGPGDDAAVPRPGGALRHPLHHRRRDRASSCRRTAASTASASATRRSGAKTVDARDGRGAEEARRARARTSSPRAASPTAPPATPPSSATSRRSSSAAATPRWRTPPSCRSSPARSRSSTAATSSAPRRSCSTARAPTENIELLTPYVVDRFEAGESGALGRAVLRNAEDGDGPRTLEIDGAFIAIGHRPNSDLVAGQVDLDDERLRAGRGTLDARRSCRACSPPATSSTTPTARR